MTHRDEQVAHRDENDASGYFYTFDELQLDPSRDAPRKVHVFVPREHDSTTSRYPAIYMNDGHTAF